MGDRDVPVTYAIGVDIGGTFTDCVALGSDGSLAQAKVFTDASDRSASFFGAVAAVADELGYTENALLARCDRVVHGTTTGTNALVSRQGASVGLLGTAGHGDVMFLMKGGGRTAGLPTAGLLDIVSSAKPEPLVSRDRIREVIERTDVDGDCIIPLDEAAARQAISELLHSGVESFAISFLWSVRNPATEQRVGELVGELDPEAFVSCASELASRVGEYERTTVAVMNAYIGPLMRRYVDAIEEGIQQRGFEGRVLYAQCAGGAITGDEARRAPIRTLQSGPVSGIVGSAYLGKSVGYPNVIAADMGGTTFDVSVIRDGVPLARDVSMCERYEMALPMLDVESIGAGGGSVAWMDESGRLEVGPRSAAADPGPACYGRGGQEPTVTDADVVLGFISPDAFFGGRMRLDQAAAEKALFELGQRLGLGLYETAAGVNRIVDSKMSDLILRMSVLRGFDPRDFVCFAFGGGGPVHASALAKEIGLREVVVPLLDVAPVWSAFGAATADVSHLFQQDNKLSFPCSPHDLNEVFDPMERHGRQVLVEEGFPENGVVIERSLRMKHTAQIHDVDVPIRGGSLEEKDLPLIDHAFARVYAERYGEGAGYREAGIQITGFQVRATGTTYKPDLANRTISTPAEVEETERAVYWSESSEFLKTPVLQVKSTGTLRARVEGPALIELPHTVVVVRPGQTAKTDDLGNLIVTV